MTGTTRRAMSALILLATVPFALPACAGAGEAADQSDPDIPTIEWGLVMHGGAGTITRESMTPEREREYRETMEAAMQAGHRILENGGGSLDAVVAAINVLEDSPLFNSGRGAVFTADGTNSLDSSIMHGPTLEAGAVAGVTTVKNPITLARLVMEESPHVLLSGEGAEEFAALQGVEMVDPSYFHTERRWRALERAREAERQAEQQSGLVREDALAGAGASVNAEKFGTVGVVALDRDGGISAGTSTGGMTNKKWGRIGDSPIIGAGTYANDNCGISATGWGEYFIRNVVAYDICARAEYLGISVHESARRMIMEQLEAQEPETGGIVGLEGDGSVVMMFNSPGMYRGYVGADGQVHTAIYRD
ncbi:MAG TPA: isoaspartyl peptidase/L-asparaginase [Longimicrobiales bacterium]|nr:isoaspartyl peptidase/L-asparaginase [Longimicrobiales bacterium]